MYSCETIKLLLLGKTGTGKSATANTILGRHAFDSGSSMCSVTKKVREETKYHDTGAVIKIIDGPGLAADDVRGSIETVHSMLEHLEDDPKGYIAPLLVMRYGQRFCREDYRTVEMLQNILGKDIIKHHCIIVMTCGDLFEKDSHDITFVKWCHGQTGIFDDIFWECRQRVILFDNKTSDRRKKEDQVNRLLDLIKSSRVKGNCGNEAYMKVKATCLSPSSVASCDDEHYFDMIGQLNKQFWEIISHKPGREVTELEQLLEKVYHLENKIQETSLGENVAKRTFVENLKGSIDTQIEKLRKQGNSTAAKVSELAF